LDANVNVESSEA